MASIRKRPRKDGTVAYRVEWRTGGTRDGGRDSETFGYQHEARNYRARVEAAGHHRPPDDEPAEDAPDESGDVSGRQSECAYTFDEWAERVLASLTGVYERTRDDYRKTVARHFSPRFGAVAVTEVDQLDHVRAWVNDANAGEWDPRKKEWARKPLKAKTLRNHHGLLHQIFSTAVAQGIRRDNPCDGNRLPDADDDPLEAVFLTPQEFATIRSCADADVRDLLTVAVGTGLRWGELTALRVRDVQLFGSKPTVRVAQAWKRQPGGSHILGRPKTKASRRTIRVDREVVDALAGHVAGKTSDDLVFTTPGGARWHQNHFRERRWLPATTAAAALGVTKRPRVHDLRHTHASWLVAAGRPMLAVGRRLGHTSVTTTERYSHLLPAVDEGDVAALSAAFASGAEPAAAAAGQETERAAA